MRLWISLPPGQYYCWFCARIKNEKTTYTLEELKIHFNMHLRDNKPHNYLYCNACQIAYRAEPILVKHFAEHFNIYKCIHCGKFSHNPKLDHKCNKIKI
jgi:hypothetical protein